MSDDGLAALLELDGARLVMASGAERFAEPGIVSLTAGPHRTRVPALIADRVHLEIDLTGRRSVAAVDGTR